MSIIFQFSRSSFAHLFIYIYIHDLFKMFNVFFFIFVVFNVFPLACSYYCVFFLWSLLNLYYASLLQLSVIWGCFEFSLSSVWLKWTIIIYENDLNEYTLFKKTMTIEIWDCLEFWSQTYLSLTIELSVSWVQFECCMSFMWVVN
jgi:hypothetical protein